MIRKLVIAALPAALALGYAGSASATILMNGGGENGVKYNGGGSNGVHVNGGGNNGTSENGQGSQGTGANGSAGAIVISIELPAPVAH